MDTFTWSGVASNFVSMAIGVATLWGAVVRPYQRRLEATADALSLANSELKKLHAAQIVETLAAQKQLIAAASEEINLLKDSRYKDLMAVSAQISTAIQQGARDGTESRRQIHHRLDTMEGTIQRLDERTQSTNKTLETIAAEVREVGKEVAAALAQLSRN